MQQSLKFVVITAFLHIIFISNTSFAKNTELLSIQPKIVGGVAANEGDWPWMSALVYTSNDISATLTVDTINYASQPFSGSITGNAAGNTIDCGIGNTPCSNASEKICLIERGEIDFSLKVENCQAGGGIGAIIYNNVDGNLNGTLGKNFSGTIPAISITKADGASLKANIGTSASLTVVEYISQSISCGASFLGDKWLLTASHCVEGRSPQKLKVNVGEYNLSNGAENIKAVKRIYMHADYELNIELDNDIALIELVDSVDNPAITLVDSAATEQFSIDNSTVTVVGWGGREGYAPDGGPTSDFPDLLHQVDLELLTNSECKDILAESSTESFVGTYSANDVGITNAMICAFIPSGGKSACQGDSGGPLMINTNEGWQQIGIVSWGIGCAAEGFPDVYTRTAFFSDWVNGITQGIAIDQRFDFGTQPENQTQSATLDIVNNSELSANLTFEIDGNTNFTIVNDDCNSIAAGETCLLQISYKADGVGKHTANITIDSDNSEIATSSAKIFAQSIALAGNIQVQLSSTDNALTWYSGGNSAWLLDNSEAAIISGDINNNQESIVMVTVSGEGTLSFEWSVSSEENTISPENPYDALYLYVDDELVNFISGDIDYESETVRLTAGEHKITWIYEKDSIISAGKDNARIRNVTFTPVNAITPTSSSSGGSISWLSLIFMAIISLRRK
jgi:secreted trypsin-like serine protease